MKTSGIVALILSFLFTPYLFADTLILKNGKELKGLVVEHHSDRVILSTEKGEVPVLLKRIKKISYDDPEQNFLQVGKAYEAEGKLGEALAYYEKALELNPNLVEAKNLAAAVKNRFWASSAEGPRNEVEMKQTIYDSWGQQKPIDEIINEKKTAEAERLKENLGIKLAKIGDWVVLDEVSLKKDAWLAGLRKGDRLVSIDGQSLRYMTVEAVTKKMLTPRYSNFNLELERYFQLNKSSPSDSIKKMGFALKLEYQGIFVQSVQKNSLAEESGIKENDLLVMVDNNATRYTPLNKVVKQIQDPQKSNIELTIRRNALLARR